MPPLRQLRPVEPPIAHLPLVANHGQPTIRQKRKHYSKEEWERQKEPVFQYYCKDGLSLEKTMAKIASTGFVAQKRTWKTMIKAWGFEKNIPSDTKQVMLQKKKDRSMKGKKTTFVWKGHKVPEKRLAQFENLNIRGSTSSPIPQAETPEELQYFTPDNAQTLLEDCDIEHATKKLNYTKSDRRFQLIVEQAEKVVSFVTIEEVSASARRYTERASHMKSQDHHHQMGRQELTCSGYFSKSRRPHLWLIEARNLAICLSEVIHGSRSISRKSEQPASTKTVEFVFLSGGENSSSLHDERLFVECIKQNNFSSSLLGLNEASIHLWNQNWKSMDMESSPLLDTLARRIFGDLMIPYPNMSMSSLVHFNPNSHPDDCKLLRITFGIDRRPEIQECRYCEPAFMTLDCIGPDGALKVHIPLLHAGHEQPCLTEKDYSDCFLTNTRTLSWNLISLASSYQGWSYETRCYQENFSHCCFNKSVEEWDPDGSDEQDRPFQPFPPDRESHLCFNSYLLGGLFASVEKGERYNIDEQLESFEPSPREDDCCYDQGLYLVDQESTE